MLNRALSANRAALNDMAAFGRTDVAFHFALASIGNNPVFAALHSGIADWLSLQRHISLRVVGAAERALQSHEAIFAAVAVHKPEEAWLGNGQSSPRCHPVLPQEQGGFMTGILLVTGASRGIGAAVAMAGQPDMGVEADSPAFRVYRSDAGHCHVAR